MSAKHNVATIEPAPPVAQSEAGAIVSMIERMARDPQVNVDKVREFMALRKEMLADEAEQKFNDAMARTQSEMRAVAVDASNPQTRSKYASYFALDKAVRPIYTKHGFGLSFDTADGAPEGCIRVVCYVTCAGHTRKYHVDMPADGKGAKGGDVMTKTHAAGAAMTYGQRYLLKMIFNIAVGEDVDGNAPVNNDPISDEQAARITTLVAETKSNIAIFLKWIGAESISDIPARKYAAAIAGLEAKRNKQ